MRFMIALAAAALLATPTLAQKGGFRSPSISRPMSVSRPAPSYSRPAYRPTPTVSRPAPVAQVRRPAIVRPVPQVRAPQAVAPQRYRRDTIGRPVGRPMPRRYSYRGSNWGWTAPAIMPIWWMSTMDRPYTFDSYDEFIRQCLRTPPRRRSRECVIALRERGIRG